MKRIIIIVVSMLVVTAFAAIGIAIVRAAPPAQSGALLWGEGAFDRVYEVSAFSSMIDEDGDATIIKSKSNTLRFEEKRLLVDGYVCAQLTSEMRHFKVVFTENYLSISADGSDVFERTRKNPRLEALKLKGLTY